jgi:hypothetical protein
MLERTSLDTVVKGLELLVGPEGKYAPKARVGGALAALVHLGHPVIAIRTLSAAWEEDAVDTDTATWLIGEVMRIGTDESILEAARLLAANVPKLSDVSKPENVSWPAILWDRWPTNLPDDARLTNLFSILEVLMSHPRRWWGDTLAFGVVTLDEARTEDPQPEFRYYAGCALKLLIATYGPEPTGVATTWKGPRRLDEINSQVASLQISDFNLQYHSGLLQRFSSWANPAT